MKTINKDNMGISLVEIILVMAMVSVLSIFIIASMFSTHRSVRKQSTAEAIEQSKNDLQMEFINNIRWAENIEYFADEGRLLVRLYNGTEIDYQFSDGVINKNGSRIISQGLEIVDFEVILHSDNSLYDLVEINITIHSSADDQANDSFTVLVSPRNKIPLEDTGSSGMDIIPGVPPFFRF